MPAYLICQFDSITDREALERYLPIASASIAKYCGTYLVRADSTKEILEGTWKPPFIVEFPNADRLRAWYHSEDYSPALDHRPHAGPRDLLLVEGVAADDA